MRRNVQLWRFHDANGKPVGPIRASALHRYLADREQAGDYLDFTGTDYYETQLAVVPGTQPHVVLHRIRGDNLPSQRRNGKIVDLDPSVNELAEGSQFLFLERNLVAFMGTGFSPRPSRLAEWMRNRLDWEVWLEPVLRADAGAVLDHLRKVTSVEVKIAADEARNLDLGGFFEGEDDPLATLLTAQRAQQGGIITVGWSVGQGSEADQGWFKAVVDRLRRADLSPFRAAKAKVYVEDADSAVPFDFLHDRLVAEVEVDQPTGRQRLLAPDVALGAMQQAWTQFQDTDKVLDRIDKPQGAPFKTPPSLIDVPASGSE